MNTLRNLAPTEVAEGLGRRSIVLVDVREPREYAAERIHGALLFPLSAFDPAALPDPGAREIVFYCGSGRRSAMAAERCLAAGVAHAAHLAGGLQAWRQAGYPVIRIDPATGGMVEVAP